MGGDAVSKRFCMIRAVLAVFLLTLTASAEESVSRADELMKHMTLQEKICQMLIILPENMTDEVRVLKQSENMRTFFTQYPCGGIVIRGRNIASASQLQDLTRFLSDLSPSPFLICTEEGGDTSAIAGKLSDNVPESLEQLAKRHALSEVYAVWGYIATYMKELGLNMNMAPVLDMMVSGDNSQLSGRCAGSDRNTVSQYGYQALKGLTDSGVIAVVKHFPGTGRATAPTGDSIVTVTASEKLLYENDLMPFRLAFAAGAPCVLVSSAVYSAIAPDTPACFSDRIVKGLLRDEMGFEGVVISDDLSSTALTGAYTQRQIAVNAVKAGCDMLLLPQSTDKAVRYLTEAVVNGEINEEQIDGSVLRILKLKLEYGIIR